jgi:hypothetical protein
MKDNIHLLANLRMNQIILPGTHDSGAYNILPTPISENPQAAKIYLAMKYLSYVKQLLSYWTITQDKSIKQQLESGARALDLRISFYEHEQQFYISHTFALIKLDEALIQIKEFMQENTGELMVILIKPDWENKQTMHGHEPELLEKMQEQLGYLLCNNNCAGDFDSNDLKISTMLARNERILVCYEGNINNQTTKIWPTYNFNSHFFNQTTAGAWQSEFDKIDLRYRTNMLLEISLALTPTADYIKYNAWRHFLPVPDRSLRYMAKSAAYLINPILSKNAFNGCIISTDFISFSTVDQIIKHNIILADNIIPTIVNLGPQLPTLSGSNKSINSTRRNIRILQLMNDDDVLIHQDHTNKLLEKLEASVTTTGEVITNHIKIIFTKSTSLHVNNVINQPMDEKMVTTKHTLI